MFATLVAWRRSWVSGLLPVLTRPKFCGRFRLGQTGSSMLRWGSDSVDHSPRAFWMISSAMVFGVSA